MDTASLLFNRSKEIPEGLYLELMNKLKIDFDKNLSANNVKIKIIVINKNIPKYIQCTKQKLIHDIIKRSIDFDNREEILLKITGRISFPEIKVICRFYFIPTVCINPRWQRQQDLLHDHPNLASRSHISVYDI